ncbi:MAG: CapA family protein [Parahaliea sp.]
MIFLGDIAHPFSSPPDWSALRNAVDSQPTVVNLEGALTGDTHWTGEHRLFNHRSVLPALADIGTCVAGLANNHICDLADGPVNTRRELAAVGITPVGAGGNLAEAAEPAHIEHAGRNYVFVAFGWSTIQCVPALQGRPGTQPFCPRSVVERIGALRAQYPDAIIIPLLHWNFELEPHPQPAHRQVAFAAIEAGADAVIGHHPHCVGGIEFHRGRLIAYSIGNWWLPQGVFFGGRLNFPEYASPQVALEWHPDRPAQLHWFFYDRDSHAIGFDRSESVAPDSDLSVLTPYAGFSASAYRTWFSRNRLKRKALPVYADPNARWLNGLFDQYVRWRHPAIVAIKHSLALFERRSN